MTPYLLASPPVQTSTDISGNEPQPFAINDAGTVAGRILEVTPLPPYTIFGLGFVRSGGSTIVIPAPQPSSPGSLVSVYMMSINNLNQAVGFTTEIIGIEHKAIAVYAGDHGILWSGGQLQTIDYPGALGTRIFGISNMGDMVGAYAGSDRIPHAFKLSNGVFTQIFPVNLSPKGDAAFGINSSEQIVGVNFQFSSAGFQMEVDGSVTQLQPPSLTTQVFPLAINDAGDSVGYIAPGYVNTAFLRRQGVFSWFSAPDAGPAWGASIATGLNNAGQIVGEGGIGGSTGGHASGWSTSCQTPVPAALTLLSGDGQAGAPGNGFIVPLLVKVARSDGAGIQGIGVNFAVTSGNASFVSRDRDTGGLVPATGATSSEPDGSAYAFLLLGSTPGAVTVTASVAGLPPVQFHAAAVAASTSLTSVSGNGQSAFEGTLPNPLVVKVSGPNGGPGLAGIPITFATASGTASLNPPLALTGADGTASTIVTIGVGPTVITAAISCAAFVCPAGLNTVSFTATGMPCDFGLNPAGQAFPAQGGTGTIAITAVPGCPWSVGTLPAGVTLTSSGSGVGGGSVTFQVSQNSGGYSSNSVSIGTKTFTIEQSAFSLPGLTAAGSLGQVAAEGTWDFSLIGINLGSSAATARFAFFDNNGEPLAMPLTFPQLPSAAGPLLAPVLDRTLSPNAQIVLESTGPDNAATLIGSGQLLSTGNVSGFGIFSRPASHWNAVVPIETRNASKYILAFDNTGTLTTGVAVANLTLQAVNVPVLIRDETGAQIGNQTISLSLRGHTSFMLNDPAFGFLVTNGKRGTLEFDTPPFFQISVLGLRANGPALTTLPVLANVGNSGGSITHVAYNGGWTSVFYLVNTGDASAQFTLSFFDENGIPLPVPLLLPQSGTTITTSALTRTLEAGAMLVVNTQAQNGTVVTGSAQLATTSNISGFEIFRWDTFSQEASVPLETRTPNSFVLVFDNTNGLTTGVALANLSGSAANIAVTLRDDTGALLLPSTPINLPALEHKSFMLSDPAWYPATANKRGMVEFVVPQGGQISVIGLRAGSDDTLTTIPVLTK